MVRQNGCCTNADSRSRGENWRQFDAPVQHERCMRHDQGARKDRNGHPDGSERAAGQESRSSHQQRALKRIGDRMQQASIERAEVAESVVSQRRAG
jgi:hypothetical protein